MEIPFVDLSANYERIQAEVDNRMKKVVEDTAFIGGDSVETFEQRFADYLGVDHGVGVASGTDAIFLALKALGVGDGDEVATVSHTFVSTVDGIVNNGARPKFVDVDPDTYTMDPEDLEEKISEDTAAIMPVHLYGQAVDLDPIKSIADEHNIPILEDTCQGHGSTYRGEMLGTYGDIACYSFYPSKNLGAFGDGGFVATDDPELASAVRKLREYGESEKYQHEIVGYNSRLDAIQAAVLNGKLDHLDDWNSERRDAAAKYRDRLENTPLELPIEAEWGKHIYHLYVVRAESETQRDALQNYLESSGISTGIHYPIPVHQQPSYQELQCSFERLPVTEDIASKILSLPMYPEITDQQINAVCDAIKQFYISA